MDDLDELWRALDRIATTPRLLVACDFDGALAPDLGDPDNARAEQSSSEALNVLLALRNTTVAGFFFLLPVVVVWIVLAKAWTSLSSAGTRVAEWVGVPAERSVVP